MGRRVECEENAYLLEDSMSYRIWDTAFMNNVSECGGESKAADSSTFTIKRPCERAGRFS